MKQQAKKWYESSNFWTALVLLVGGVFVGFPEDAGREAVALVFALIAAGKTIQNYVSTHKPELLAWVQDANFWNYLGVLVVALVPTLDPQVITLVEEITRGVIAGNWQGVIISVFSLATILYKALKPEPEPQPSPAKKEKPLP